MGLKIYATDNAIKIILQDDHILTSLSQDIDLAIINSLETLLACKKLNIPVIMLINDHQLLEQAIKIGISDYLYLPLDHTELKNRIKLQTSRNKAEIDQLTNAYNRNYLEFYTNDVLTNYAGLSVLMVDLDNFKSINDQYGHIKGDEILSNAAQAIKQSIRTVDILVRFGGDEFIILLPKTALKQAEIIAARIKDNIALSLLSVAGSVSIGVAAYEYSESIKDLIHRADQALYRAKKTGKNQVLTSNT